tara:strand:- start:88 stop:351 length:264 start_codon:yes stop_codon:yes gene_type:complete
MIQLRKPLGTVAIKPTTTRKNIMNILTATSNTLINSLSSVDELLKGSKNLSIAFKKGSSILAIEAALAQQEALSSLKDEALLIGIEL